MIVTYFKRIAPLKKESRFEKAGKKIARQHGKESGGREVR